jgi:cytochrome c oxidase cbb3-type subunit 4
MNVDVNDWRNVVTVLSFFLFAGIVKWALSKRHQSDFDEAEQLPFLDDTPASMVGSVQARQERRDE